MLQYYRALISDHRVALCAPRSQRMPASMNIATVLVVVDDRLNVRQFR
jgi:hypothetical protein